MSNSRAYPRLKPFERLSIADGLAINAERWQQAHTYHRQRQNFHYQALYQPGIVYGLGVAVVPEQSDPRLLQVQPGIAIDIEGNPIVVQQPEEFRIVSEPKPGEPCTIYLVLNYVDPDQLRHSATATVVRETFRIREKLQMEPEDVEICRIRLEPGLTAIQLPTNVFAPGINQLDFRGRCFPQPYPRSQVKVGLVYGGQNPDLQAVRGWSQLLRSLPGLYPSLQAVPTVQPLSARGLGAEPTIDCQLLSIPYATFQGLANPAIQRLRTYLEAGGVLVLGVDFAEVNLGDLMSLEQELHLGLAEARRDPGLWQQMGSQLQEELVATQTAIQQQLLQLEQGISPITAKLGLSLADSGEIDLDHPLRTQPFLFSQWPDALGHPVFLKNWGGLVLLVGDLSHCWGGDPALRLSREVLRSAQELGINLLEFAACRWRWTQAMRFIPTTTQGPTDTLQRRLSSL